MRGERMQAGRFLPLRRLARLPPTALHLAHCPVPPSWLGWLLTSLSIHPCNSRGARLHEGPPPLPTRMVRGVGGLLVCCVGWKCQGQ